MSVKYCALRSNTVDNNYVFIVILQLIVIFRASLLCEMEKRMNAARNGKMDHGGGTNIKLVEVTSDILKETALSHQSETKV